MGDEKKYVLLKDATLEEIHEEFTRRYSYSFIMAEKRGLSQGDSIRIMGQIVDLMIKNWMMHNFTFNLNPGKKQ